MFSCNYKTKPIALQNSIYITNCLPKSAIFQELITRIYSSTLKYDSSCWENLKMRFFKFLKLSNDVWILNVAYRNTMYGKWTVCRLTAIHNTTNFCMYNIYKCCKVYAVVNNYTKYSKTDTNHCREKLIILK